MNVDFVNKKMALHTITWLRTLDMLTKMFRQEYNKVDTQFTAGFG